VTGSWWGRAESAIGPVDRERVATLHAICGETPKRILELGCGYGSTVAAMSEAGHHVTGVEISDPRQLFEQFVEHSVAHRASSKMISIPFSSRVALMSSATGTASASARHDQRVLLRRVANEWLTEGGTALFDISNPFVCARWDGDEEHKPARPEHGDDYDLCELTAFDPIRNRFADTWWITSNPGEKLTQTIRCYAPADLQLITRGHRSHTRRSSSVGRTRRHR